MKKRIVVSVGVLFSFIMHAQKIPDNFDLFEHKNIVILGGTGFIGRAITHELLKYNPRRITIFSRDEVKHFNMMRGGESKKVHHVIGDVRDYDDVVNVTRGADIVFHAAALKRIDILESNITESIKTNIIGSINLFNACIANNVAKVLFISSDKACYPVNCYGACKFVSEKLFTNYDPRAISTQFIVARYGNVLESTGSVIPIFNDKIQKGEDIPLTSAEMTRFIVNKDDAIALIFNALRYGIGGEIFVSKLPAMKIIDLIDILKEQHGASNNIQVIGLRPGEKIHEMLINETEIPRTIDFGDFFVVQPTVASLHSYHEQEMPIYMVRGKHMDTTKMHSFSSDQVVAEKDVVKNIFNQLGLLDIKN